MRLESAYERITTSLGGRSVGVELTHEDLALCVEEALRRYSRQNPLKRRVAQTAPARHVNKYVIAPSAYSVYDVQFQNPLQVIETPLDSGSINIFNPLTNGTSGGGYGGAPKAEDYELMLQWREMTGRVYSLEPDYYFDDDPQPDGTTDDIGDYAPKALWIFNPTGWPLRVSWQEVQPRPLDKVSYSDEDWVLDWATAVGKQILARKRGKVETIPMAGQQIKLDGEVLRQEAIADFERLEKDLRARFVGLPAPIWG